MIEKAREGIQRTSKQQPENEVNQAHHPAELEEIVKMFAHDLQQSIR